MSKFSQQLTTFDDDSFIDVVSNDNYGEQEIKQSKQSLKDIIDDIDDEQFEINLLKFKSSIAENQQQFKSQLKNNQYFEIGDFKQIEDVPETAWNINDAIQYQQKLNNELKEYIQKLAKIEKQYQKRFSIQAHEQVEQFENTIRKIQNIK